MCTRFKAVGVRPPTCRRGSASTRAGRSERGPCPSRRPGSWSVRARPRHRPLQPGPQGCGWDGEDGNDGDGGRRTATADGRPAASPAMFVEKLRNEAAGDAPPPRSWDMPTTNHREGRHRRHSPAARSRPTAPVAAGAGANASRESEDAPATARTIAARHNVGDPRADVSLDQVWTMNSCRRLLSRVTQAGADRPLRIAGERQGSPRRRSTRPPTGHTRATRAQRDARRIGDRRAVARALQVHVVIANH